MKTKRTTTTAAKEKTKNIGVELLDPVRRRLRVYAAAQDITIKRVVNEALDEYLKKRGA